MATYSVGDLATMAGITVRALHHYHEIGLLIPPDRSPSGYRLYDDESVDRLRTILAYRELGLGLDEITSIVDDQSKTRATLDETHKRLIRKIERLQAIAASLTQAIEETHRGDTMTAEDKLSVFGGFDPADHADEAMARWGQSDEYEEHTRRTRTRQTKDWGAIQDEANELYARFLALKAAGVPADSREAAVLVAEHRAHITRWFYDCAPQVHAGLGQMYLADRRFADAIDKSGTGVAEYLSEAIAAAYDE